MWTCNPFTPPFVRLGDMEKVNLHAIHNIGQLLGQVAWGKLAPDDGSITSDLMMAVGALRQTLVMLLMTYPEMQYSRRQANKLVDDIERWYAWVNVQLSGGDPIDLKMRVTTDDLVVQARSF